MADCTNPKKGATGGHFPTSDEYHKYFETTATSPKKTPEAAPRRSDRLNNRPSNNKDAKPKQSFLRRVVAAVAASMATMTASPEAAAAVATAAALPKVEAMVAKEKAIDAVVMVAEAEAKEVVLAKVAVLARKAAAEVTRKQQGHVLSATNLVMVIEMSAQMVRLTIQLKKFSARAKSHRREATTLLVQLEWLAAIRGGAAEESALTDADEAELEVKLLEAQLKAMKAKKRAEGSKDNNRSGGAATDSHHGWE
jgi:hypothetical protein